MRLLLTLVILCAALWSGYWYVTSTAMQEGLSAWLADRRAEGWVAETSDLSVAGFPNRIDTTFSDLALADPGTGLAWEAPLFQILALSYKPNHLIAVWPHEQRIATPYDKYDVISTDMRASLIVEATTDLALKRLTLTAENLEVENQTIVLNSAVDRSSLTALTLAAERVEGNPAPAYRFGFLADGFAPSVPWKVQLDPTGMLPVRLKALHADVLVTFDAPWDRFAIETARPQPRVIKLRLAEAKWGQLELQMAGDLIVDEAGLPSGTLAIKARNWREILELGVKSGAIPDVLAGSLEEGLGMLAYMAGKPSTLDVALEFSNGRVFLGPIPIGPAPVLRIR
ncbi:MAG: DUF2125 domain-containing protein [Roseovarius sp.]|nr:DUF2125 domain-containing protein [Roseovarius sp.]